MTGIDHLSMRVPWRDRPWDQFICDDPLGNSSCTLLSAIGAKRDDAYEVSVAGRAIDQTDQNRLPCLSERATFMSPVGYSVVKQHPYSFNQALKGHLFDTTVAMPPYAFEAVPFRWMNRQIFDDEVGIERVPKFDAKAEERVHGILNYKPPWVMDGHNQRELINAFFEDVVPGESLVFTYLKNSPFQDERTDRLLVGAARVAGKRQPPMWDQSNDPPFMSSMWETVIEHTLRPDMKDGVLLPYQQLVTVMDDGVSVDQALAWAPEARSREFSYVTEHLSDDAAIEALAVLRSAAEGMVALGVPMPPSSIEWVDSQTKRLWKARGPAPGLPGVLAELGVQHPHTAARALGNEAGERDPWEVLDAILADPQIAPSPIKAHISKIHARVWSKLTIEEQATLRLLSGFDIAPSQTHCLFECATEVALEPGELLENPYFAATCTYGQPEHVPFVTVDRALFPPEYVEWTPQVPDSVKLEGPLDRRRIEALLTDVLERCGTRGDTVLPLGEAIEMANSVDMSQQPNLTETLLKGLDLDQQGIEEWETWSPLTSGFTADGLPTIKLTRFDETSDVIRTWIAEQESRTPLGALPNARAILDAALDRNVSVNTNSSMMDELEERARQEKASGLSALHDSPLSVLIGPAGTGKTTLLRALVDHPGLDNADLLLLAPTGKARVQLESKVGRQAKTLASYLAASERYDGATGRYLVWGEEQPRRSYGLVVIDEASMLTEEMLAATLDSFAGVKRLILVGDPRQLPPIGAGRPFVDLVTKIAPSNFDSWVRVAPGYVELQIPRRQLPDGSQGIRHDLELAACFGGTSRGAGDEDIWSDLSADGDLPTISYRSWAGQSPVDALTNALTEHLDLPTEGDSARAFALTYGATENQQYLNWEPGAGELAESWQILSPTRSRAFGTVELNRHIKRTYRGADLEFAKRYGKYNVPKPLGPEQIIRGDKVMQTVNRKLNAWPSAGALNYVANGEIGVAIGRLTLAAKRPKNKLQLNVEFSSQPGFQYSYWPSDTDDPNLELAWAVTVHKSQGSEFDTTFLMLPARANVSRELMYTALTRQRDRVVILHEGSLADLRELAQPWRSETARRLTDLFQLPQPVTLEVRGDAQRFDRTLMHVAVDGTPMASKNEVIIAGILDVIARGRWSYEQPLTGEDGRVVLPDFTVVTPDGHTVYWEHAGMLDLPEYARKWELKKQWYRDNGVIEHAEGGGPKGILMWTDDLEGANAQEWQELATSVLGVATPDSVATATTPRPNRRIAKKAPPRKG